MDYFLATDDVVGISFWIATAVMAAGALFFFVERSTVKASWQTSLTVAALVCFVAFWHYMYMRDVWVATGESPTVYRYIDWLITVPMQIVEFYLILAACTAVSLGVFWKLLAGSLVMLLGGYFGETGVLSPMVGFVIGMAGWIFIIYYIFVGEAAQIKDSAGNENLVLAFDGIKWIVTIGWAIYPIGYFMGYLGGGVDANGLNTLYNLADLVNKFLFGLVIWYAAMRDSGVAKG
ncbi:MAG: xanthorhodopsin [Gammaproteobacteria bacterium]|jgi:bacteriorhodopsin|nr:MAG: xanthorhodopsin [Gammaproteobacteria bacterium]|tara:strand:- start:327 stop:1028 length:702 start_codon:yes stop_codon:yes gene_type:complete